MKFELEYTLTGHTGSVAACRFLDADTLISVSADQTCLKWSIPRDQQILSKLRIENQMNTEEGSSSIQATNIIPELLANKFPAGLNDLAIDKDYGMIAVACDDHNVYLSKLRPTVASHSPELVESNETMEVEEDAKTNPTLHTLPARVESGWFKLEGHTGHVFCVAFNGEGTLMASGSFDESVRLWDIRTGKCFRILESAHGEPVTSVAFNHDSSLLATASYDGLTRIWDVINGRCIKTFADETLPAVGHIRWSDTGKYILVSTLDSTIRLWSLLESNEGTNSNGTDENHTIQARRPTIRSSTPSITKVYTGHLSGRFCTPVMFIPIPKKGNGNLSGGQTPPNNAIGNSSAPPPHLQPSVYIASGSEDGRFFFWHSVTKAIVDQCQVQREPIIGMDIIPYNLDPCREQQAESIVEFVNSRLCPYLRVAVGGMEGDHVIRVYRVDLFPNIVMQE